MCSYIYGTQPQTLEIVDRKLIWIIAIILTQLHAHEMCHVLMHE